MRVYYCFILCWFSFTCAALAQNRYETAAIPKELMPYASAVVRNQEIFTEVKDLQTTIHRVKTAVTIINKNGDNHANIDIWYDKNRRIKYVKGAIYDEFGKPVSRFTERNFSDHSAADGITMFTDNRLRHFEPTMVNYPYTIEYEYEINLKQSLNLQSWEPQQHMGTAVQHSEFVFISKPDFNIRYKELNYSGKAASSLTATGQKMYKWEMNQQKALRYEPYSPDAEIFQTSVKLAPEKFNYESVDGTFADWQGTGKWVYDKLLVGRTVLPQSTIAYVRALTDSIKNPKLKAKAIYEYMQHKSRYISIQVGIGGLQPFSATEVDQLSYGDCKGLVNYTQALLKAANIDSYYCIVEAGTDKKSLMPDFASIEQGNHIILCLPFKNDTTWLECTSKTLPFGYLGEFTDDRLVLACTPEGGKLMRTPLYGTADSKQVRKAHLALKPSGVLSGSMTTTFEGWQYENITDTPGELTDEIKSAQKRYAINNLDIEHLSLKPTKNIQPLNREEMQFTARDYASELGGRVYFMVNLANRLTQVPRDVRNRLNDVYINRGYTDIDELVYDIPQGYKLDSNPLAVSLSKPFGKFTAHAFINGEHQLVYQRKLELKEGTYPKEQYAELVEFYQHIADADNYKVALIKN
jgi:transglutaminase-like putative cysteine protease